MNTSYYDDVVEERGCIEVCGYPLCSNTVKRTNQKYHISTKQNKVFDITERKVKATYICNNAVLINNERRIF